MRLLQAAVVLAFATSPVWTTRLCPDDYQGGRSRDVVASAERNTSALAAMLGGFRTAVSDLLYIKTERYLHSGVAYAPHLEGETLSTAGVISEIDEHHGEASSRGRLVTEHREIDEPLVLRRHRFEPLRVRDELTGDRLLVAEVEGRVHHDRLAAGLLRQQRHLQAIA